MIKMISAFRDGGGGDDDDVVAEEEGDGDKGLYLGKGNVSLCFVTFATFIIIWVIMSWSGLLIMCCFSIRQFDI